MAQDTSAETIGQRIAKARKMRGLTQTELARLVPCSKSLIAQVERGHKPASPALVASAARALHVEINDLTGQPYDDGTTAASSGLLAAIPDIRRALLSWNMPDESIPARPTAELRADVRHASTLGREARYIQLGERLPSLLEELSTAVHAAPERDQPALYGQLAEAYTGVTAIAYVLGNFDLRSQAMDRVEWAASNSQDPLRIARTRWQRSTLFLAAAAWQRGMQLLERVRHDLGDDIAHMDAATLSVYGAAHLRSAVFAARAGNAQAAWDHIAEARAAGRLLGSDQNHYGLEFGPSNVAIHAVGVAVDLYDGAEAARLAREIHLDPAVPPVRRGHYYIDLARGWLYAGDRDKALEALQAARRCAPQQTRNHPMVHETVRTLTGAERRRTETLAGFRAWLGIP